MFFKKNKKNPVMIETIESLSIEIKWNIPIKINVYSNQLDTYYVQIWNKSVGCYTTLGAFCGGKPTENEIRAMINDNLQLNTFKSKEIVAKIYKNTE